MSLVLEALRRVEQRPGGEAGAVGAVVSSMRPPSRSRARLWPLALGLVTGLSLLLLWRRDERSGALPLSEARELQAATEVPRLKGAAALPPPIFTASDAVPSAVKAPVRTSLAISNSGPPAAPLPTPVLQAISERDGHPVAMISDRLVREGDFLDAFKVARIGADSVEIVSPDGRHETLRFPPPPAEATASPLPKS